MKKTTFSLLACLFTYASYAQDTAVYDIVFTSNWEAHGSLPSNAHFTELVGATHNNNITLLSIGETASDGIEQVAETGAFSILESDVTSAINANMADQFIEGDNLFFNGPGRTITISDLTVSKDFPLLTLVSMLAPSPDWIVAVNGISFLDPLGDWIPETTLDLFAYDAGTEEGTTYSLSNPATSPKEPIAMLSPSDSPLINEKIGTLTITPKVLNTPSFLTPKTAMRMLPNPSDGMVTLTAPLGNVIEQIEIFNTIGKLVRTFTVATQNTTLELTDLQKGVYFVKTQHSSLPAQTQKLLLQ